MNLDRGHLEYAVLLIGLLFVGGIVSTVVSSVSESPDGYAIAAAPTSCCVDCACIREQICASCDSCIWVDRCGTFAGSLNPEGLELILSGRAKEGSTFTMNAILDPVADGKSLVALDLPNGLTVASENPTLVELKAGEETIVPFKISVADHAAENDYLIKAQVLGPDWKVQSEAQATVSVWWER